MCLLKIKNLSAEIKAGAWSKPQSLLKNINIHIRENKITALIGESGAGKTIFSRTISALLPENVFITAGNFYYKGNEVDYNRLKKIRGKEIFYAPQNAAASLNPVLKIKKQIAEVSKISRRSLVGILKFMNIEEPAKLLNSYPFELSEGENQRALLTMALAVKPSLLVLDEPTSALDIDSRREFIKLVKNIRSEYSLSILLITHNLSIVAHIADYIYIMLSGEIVEKGKPGIIFQKPSHPYTREIVNLLSRDLNI
jgi:ABC-type dipeptide/oligopeptide/nickel transport system ATPase component